MRVGVGNVSPDGGLAEEDVATDVRLRIQSRFCVTPAMFERGARSVQPLESK